MKAYSMGEDKWRIKWYKWLWLWMFPTQVHVTFDGILAFKDVKGVRYIMNYKSWGQIRR